MPIAASNAIEKIETDTSQGFSARYLFLVSGRKILPPYEKTSNLFCFSASI